MKDQKPYLADVQVGNKLYNFLEWNREYKVTMILDATDFPIKLEATDSQERVSITIRGTYNRHYPVPHFLYQPVSVLDPNNLPPRPWKLKKGEWVWVKPYKEWKLCIYYQDLSSGGSNFHQVRLQDGTYMIVDEIVPFKGELPPGLGGNRPEEEEWEG